MTSPQDPDARTAQDAPEDEAASARADEAPNLPASSLPTSLPQSAAEGQGEATKSGPQIAVQPTLAPSTSSPDERLAQVEKARSLPVTGTFAPLVDPQTLPDLPLPGAPLEAPPFARKAEADLQPYWKEQIATYEREAASLGEDPRAALLFLEIGRIYEEQLGKPRNAATSYQKAFNVDPRHPAVLHASRRLFTEVGNWGMVLEILGFEIEGAEQPELKAGLLAERGLIQEEKLKDGPGARESFERALSVWPAEPSALVAMERILRVAKDFDVLAQVYTRALEKISKADRRVPLLVAAAQLAEDRLDRPEEAIALYREVLELEPANRLALEALRRLFVATESWDPYVDVLTRCAETSPNEDEAAQLLLTAGRVLHERLDRPEAAVHTLLRALEKAPEDLVILREIEALYEENERYDEVAKVLQREIESTTEAREKVPILVKLGGLFEDPLERPDDAVRVLEEAVTLMPGYTPAKQALGRLLGRLQRFDALADLFEMEVRIEEDASVRVAKLFQLAELRLNRLDKADEAKGALHEILGIQPDYQPARKLLERLLTRSEAWAELADLYERELELVQDRDQRIFLLTRVGTLAQDELSDAARARSAYERILELAPGHLNAIRSLARVAEQQEDWPEVLRLYDLEVEATDDQKEVVAILHRAGQVQEEKAKDRAGAVVQYEKALTLNPTYLPALRSLGRLYAIAERWDDLLAMYERELDVNKSEEHRNQLLFRIADVLRDKLKAPERAAEALRRVLEDDPDNLPALRALADLHGRAGDHEALVDVLKEESRTVGDPKEKATLLMRVAELLEDRLERPDQAAEVYQDVIRLGHHLDTAIRALVRIYSGEGLWNALSKALLAAKDHAERPDTKAAILLRLAEVWGDRLGNLDRAAEYLEEALALQPEDAMVLDQLERISVGRRDWPRAVAVAKLLALHETEPRLFAARQIRIARMKETQLDPPESGADHYRLALQTVPDHPVALRALELAYRRAGDWGPLAQFYRREALVSEDGPKKASFFLRAGDIAEHRTDEPELAAQMYERALELLPDSLPALRGRRRVAERLEQAEVALDALRREGELVRDPEQRRALLLSAAKVYEGALGQADQAEATYRQLLEEDPTHPEAFQRLQAVLQEREDRAGLLALYTQRAEAVEEPAAKADLLFSAGLTAEATDAPDAKAQAKDLYWQALGLAPQHEGALVHLGPLLVQAEDWDAAIDVLHRTLAVSKDKQVRRVSLDALGVIYHEHRQDLVKCVQSLQAALQIDPNDVESLERLARVYQEAEDWGSAVNVLLRLAEVLTDPPGKVKAILDLAELYEVRAKDDRSAILAHQKVLELDPTNQTAILRLIALHERAEDWQALADVSARFVSLLPASDKEKAAPLHMKMAQVFETKLLDDARAVNALKYALDAKAEDPDALLALARIHAKNPETTASAIDAHRRLLRIDPFRLDSYHEMHRLFEARGLHDKAFVVAEILVFLRAAHQDEELYYQEHKAKVAARPEGALSAQDHDRMITHPGERGPLRAVMELLGPELAKAFPGDLAKYELNKSADRHGPRSANGMRRVADELAEALGGAPLFDLWITKKFDLKLFVESERPLALVVGHAVGRRMQEKDQRFLLSRAVEQLRGGHHLLMKVPARDLEALVWAVAKSARPDQQVPVDPSSLEAMQRVLRGLPGKTRRLLDEVGGGLFATHVDLDRHRAAAVYTANRAGLVMTNDVEVAVRNLAKDYPDVKTVFRDADGAKETIGRIAAVRELLNYAVSDEYFSARKKLGFSIQS